MIFVETVSEVILKAVMTTPEMMVEAPGDLSKGLIPCPQGL
jgi:hypothetical protein